MMLHVDQVQGNAWINVEEYKRPKFQVTLDAPKAAPRLGGEVEMQANAMAYTGATIGGAKVRYHIVREVRYPDWWYWCFAWRMPQQSGAQEIAHGTAETGADGTCTIKFTAKPDPTVAEKDEPIFRYAVTADVTDTNGETRTGERTVQAGYTALQGVALRQDRLDRRRPAAGNHRYHDHLGRRAAEGRRRAEDLSPQAAR